ncbi:hypothetical protein ANCDUO_08490 [Ancylostoma duodenale]|uniref:G-protein coupled receptors family 1 profile domain-containing protein n=1 Tax=Ancylostoma duodenale TaxID=51022 RepID=A0A0C2GQ72_9BILA|nr:hypothetical protein ANCDUO_08490 [Ancylostoma duodenale]
MLSSSDSEEKDTLPPPFPDHPSSIESYLRYDLFEMEVSIFMGIVCMVVVCGNIFVLYVLVSQPSLHTTTNFLVLSLTISDLLLGTAIIPFAIIQNFHV